MMPGGMLAMARSLAARETDCCSFFEFKVEPVGDRTVMAIRVPERYTDVLSALTGLAAGLRMPEAGGHRSEEVEPFAEPHDRRVRGFPIHAVSLPARYQPLNSGGQVDRIADHCFRPQRCPFQQ